MISVFCAFVTNKSSVVVILVSRVSGTSLISVVCVIILLGSSGTFCRGVCSISCVCCYWGMILVSCSRIDGVFSFFLVLLIIS